MSEAKPTTQRCRDKQTDEERHKKRGDDEAEANASDASSTENYFFPALFDFALD